MGLAMGVVLLSPVASAGLRPPATRKTRAPQPQPGPPPQKGSSLSGHQTGTEAGVATWRSKSRSAQSRSRGAGRWAEASSQSHSRVLELRSWKARIRDAGAVGVITAGQGGALDHQNVRCNGAPAKVA
jgi:hypothetical protein